MSSDVGWVMGENPLLDPEAGEADSRAGCGRARLRVGQVPPASAVRHHVEGETGGRMACGWGARPQDVLCWVIAAKAGDLGTVVSGFA